MGPCHHNMARLHVVGGANHLQTPCEYIEILNRRRWVVSSLSVARGPTTSNRENKDLGRGNHENIKG